VCTFQTKELDLHHINLIVLIVTVMKAKVYTISREKAISIASNHNCVTKEVAERYSDSELKEVLKQLKLKANF